jgi:hypothetical protein
MNAYEVLRNLDSADRMSEAEFNRLKIEFGRDFLNSRSYEERLSRHRDPVYLKNMVLREVSDALQEIQRRPEMQDIDLEKNAAGHVPTKIGDIWTEDNRIKTLYNAITSYCDLKSVDFNVIAVHIAEYRALHKLFFKIQRSIYKPQTKKKDTMGLYVETLNNIPSDENVPVEAKRDYYIYLLDYGWDEPIGKALMDNYAKMASLAAGNQAVVIRGTNRVHFEDEVLSWHDINGEDAQELLPAILITNRNPHRFKPIFNSGDADPAEKDLRLILIPLRKFCRNATDVVQLIERLFTDIKQRKAIQDFRIAKTVRKDGVFAMADMITLEPDQSGGQIPVDSIKNYLSSGMANRLTIEKTVFPIHFEDRSGTEFERLAFAFVNKYKTWDTLEWLGQSGDDDGRDIWGSVDSKTFCYQCANYRSLVTKKVTDDIDKLLKEKSIPDCFIVICGGRVSVNSRKMIKAYALQYGIQETEIWSGVEFEEKLRDLAPDLIKRFVHGEDFPELTTHFDKSAIALLADCFDRPAFTTPFHREVNIPDFEKAIVDTIEVLNTGMHRLRDGTLIKKIPSRHEISNAIIKRQVADVYQLVVKLRDTFVDLKRKKEIEPCGCGDQNCPTYLLSDYACQQMDQIRQDIFKQFRQIKPDFDVVLG